MVDKIHSLTSFGLEHGGLGLGSQVLGLDSQVLGVGFDNQVLDNNTGYNCFCLILQSQLLRCCLLEGGYISEKVFVKTVGTIICCIVYLSYVH